MIADRGYIDLWYHLKNLRVEINPRDEEGNTPLHYASVNGYHDLANEFIHYGADVNALNHQNESPLHWAYLSEESESIVRLLRLYKADGNTQNDMGLIPHQFSKFKENYDNFLQFSSSVCISSSLTQKMSSLNLRTPSSQQMVTNYKKKFFFLKC